MKYLLYALGFCLLYALGFCTLVVAAAGSVLIVSAAKGGLLVAQPRTVIEVRTQASAPVDFGPLRDEIAACRADVAAVRWQLETLMPTAWPDRERPPVLPRGARPPKRAETFPAAGVARKWRKTGWGR